MIEYMGVHRFLEDISEVDIPELFTFPFHYQPHPLSIIAAHQLMDLIHREIESPKSFQLTSSLGYGKMFGVLVVEDTEKNLGFLAAFSGKLEDNNHWNGFVPPVYDMLQEEGFFKIEEQCIHDVTIRIAEMEASSVFLTLSCNLKNAILQSSSEIAEMAKQRTLAKQARKEVRDAAMNILSEEEYNGIVKELDLQSADFHYRLKELKQLWKNRIEELQGEIDPFINQIKEWKQERKQRSNALQQKLFESYSFLNFEGTQKNLFEIFPIEKGLIPPSGAGECAAPKLLQYAYMNGLKPISIAEFWYGKSPNSEIRKHKQYYPSCRSKCLPILTHMMHGLCVEPNPMVIKLAEKKELEIIFNDEEILILNKPYDLLSVPGGQIADSVYQRVKEMYPQASGPLIVHRLDMSTSGLMIVALSKKAHYHIQKQFELKTIRKRYVAILDGLIEINEGEINLPLRVDLEDRPRQLVDPIHGKPSITRWNVIERSGTRTRINFYPITGRTHQLRAHASHVSGLNVPILGDDLYGQPLDRLYLHAEELEFIHPITYEPMRFERKADF